MGRLFAPYGETKTVSLTNGTPFVCPPGVTKIDRAVGAGARGTNGSPASSYYYETQAIYVYRRDNGAKEIGYLGPRTFRSGTAPASYCEPRTNTPSDPIYAQNEVCYTYDGQVTYPETPPTTGASSTALGRAFPGSLGNTSVQPTTFTDIPVNSGQSYPVSIPSGGYITITYTE